MSVSSSAVPPPAPFSSEALNALPQQPSIFTSWFHNPFVGRRKGLQGHSVVSRYGSIGGPNGRDGGVVNVAEPPPKETAINVEAKVWFANERTWLAYLSIAILVGTLSVTLYNGGKDQLSKTFGGVYGAIALGILVYGYMIFQKRITLISGRSAEHFDEVVFPLLIAASIFIAVLANLIIKVQEYRRTASSDP